LPTINLGFSGSGRMEPEVADFVAEPDAAAFVLDCLPNVQEPEVTERLGPLVRKIRAAHPAAPIVLVENVVYQDAHLLSDRRERQETSNRALRAVLAELQSAGVRGLHHVPADDLFGSDGEATVDGTHATDVGFLRLAAAIRPVLERALRIG
jgi:lysophospholipase L1-like esterase